VHCRVKVWEFTEHYARKRSGGGGGLKSTPKRNWSPRYGHVIHVSGFLVLTGIN